MIYPQTPAQREWIKKFSFFVDTNSSIRYAYRERASRLFDKSKPSPLTRRAFSLIAQTAREDS